MKELQKGVYIAQGPETNVLIRLSGKAPMLEVTTAIDLNAFYNKGKIVELALNSAEIIDIMSYPENYVFYEPAVSDSVYNKEGLESFKGKEDGKSTTDEEYEEFKNKYQEFINWTNDIDRAKSKFVIWLKTEKKFSINQGKFILNEVIRRLQPKLA